MTPQPTQPSDSARAAAQELLRQRAEVSECETELGHDIALALDAFRQSGVEQAEKRGAEEMLNRIMAWHMEQAEEESGHLPYSQKRHETHMKAIEFLRAMPIK